MHKAVIILTEAQSREEALKKTRAFMEDYGDGDVWDWYAIGGRWTQTLAPQHKQFAEQAEKILGKGEHGFVSQKEVDDKQGQLEELWKSLGGKGKNPYSNHYDLPEYGNENDAMPLADCLEIVKSWQQNVEHAKKAEEEAKKWLGRTNEKTGEKYDDWHMYGYSLKCAAALYKEEFSFEANVFNTDTYSFSIPEDPAGWFAVMVDMHN
jgi:hypothetical protein